MRIILYGWFIDYQIQLANYLSQEHTVMVVLPFDALPEEYIGALDKGVKLRLLGWHKAKWYHYRNVSLPFKIIKTINEFDPDIVHVQPQSPHLLFWPVHPFLKRCPLVFTIHDVKPHPGSVTVLTRVMRWYAKRHFDHVFVHGEILKKQMIKEYNISNAQVHTIHIGEHEVAPFMKHERPDIEEEGNLILFFGRIYKYKGLDYLIQAEPLITQEFPGARIIIAGIGENFDKYEKLMGNRRDKFIVHNYQIPYEEGAELFQRSSIVVLPYIEASQSGVIPTAYGFKKPVVVTDVGSISEIVDEGITGLIVPSRNPEALAEAIIKLLKAPNLRIEMGENAHKKLKTDFSWKKIGEKTVEVYKQALNES